MAAGPARRVFPHPACVPAPRDDRGGPYTEYYWPRRFWLLAHTVFGLLATLLGPLQFIGRLRSKHPALHRLTGKVYLVSVLMAALWIATGAAAYAAIRQRQFARHRAWMARNYTITFFFITFFAAYDLALYAGWEWIFGYTGPLVFICLLLPLAVVEAVLRARL